MSVFEADKPDVPDVQDASTDPASHFTHGGDIRGAAEASGMDERDILDFSANINPLGMADEVKAAVTSSLERSLDYPDPYCRELAGAIAESKGIDPDQILCGNGGADLIYRFAYALRPKKALIPAPTFAEYEEALNRSGTETDFYELGADFILDEGYVDALGAGHDAVFLCNPNNPTGLLTEKPVIEKLIKKAAGTGTCVFVDECFLDFVAERDAYSTEGLIGEYENLLILKSFTKLYAMPGLRLGYVISSNKELLEKMRHAGQPWGVSVPAMCAGIAAMSLEGLCDRTAAYVDREREALKGGLEALGLKVMPGRANYLCFQAKGDATLKERTLSRGILIRSCADYRGMGTDYYRVAVRTHEENEMLLDALKAASTDIEVVSGWAEKREQRR